MSEVPQGDPQDYRDDFSRFLENPPPTADPATLSAIGWFNEKMVDNAVPMTKEHFDAATESITRGDSLAGFFAAENPHVVESTGSGFLYNMGLLAHEVYNAFVPEPTAPPAIESPSVFDHVEPPPPEPPSTSQWSEPSWGNDHTDHSDHSSHDHGSYDHHDIGGGFDGSSD